MATNSSKGTKLGLKLALRSIEDDYVREAFREIQDYINQQDILRGVWRRLDIEFDKAGTKVVQHNLPFVPCDFIITGVFGGITVTIANETVTGTTFEVTSTGQGRVRLLAGNVTNFDVR